MSANAYQHVHITTISPNGAATFRRPDRRLIRDRTLSETGVATDAMVRKENVRLEERTRIAQELHDTLLQSFASASMQLHVTLNDVPLDSPVRSRLDRILQIMKKGMEEGRNAIQGLRSTDSRTLDLFLALPGIQQVIWSTFVGTVQIKRAMATGSRSYILITSPLLNPNPHYASLPMSIGVDAPVQKVWARIG